MPSTCNAALILIDVVNALDFEGSAGIVRAATAVLPRLRDLSARARAMQVPVIYVNDNFGQWRSDFPRTFEACSTPGKPGREITLALRPESDDYFVLKPMHSGFFCTPLELLLTQLQVKKLVLTGFATNICVLYTANDARMRGYDLIVPSDCTASNTEDLTHSALEHLRTVLKAETPVARDIDWQRLSRASAT